MCVFVVHSDMAMAEDAMHQQRIVGCAYRLAGNVEAEYAQACILNERMAQAAIAK